MPPRSRRIERETNHDVKAVEYFVKRTPRRRCRRWRRAGSSSCTSRCTSEDINNLATRCMLREARDQVLLPRLDALIEPLRALAHAHADVADAVAHARPDRDADHARQGIRRTSCIACAEQRDALRAQSRSSASSTARSATSTRTSVAYPEVDWPALARRFVESLGLDLERLHHADRAARLDRRVLRRAGAHQHASSSTCAATSGATSRSATSASSAVAGEVGSSTMPHKVNPIDFENAEGNLGLATRCCAHFADKLPVSRWQRDLTDSTVLRNVGVALAHALIVAGTRSSAAWASRSRPRAASPRTSRRNWEVLAEPMQTVMRRYGVAERVRAAQGPHARSQVDAAGARGLH